VLKDRNLANQLGTAARNRAVAEFSLEKLVVKNENFYRRCIEARLHE
jgi:glycosyltransferase involved in cell wall biosynthesis